MGLHIGLDGVSGSGLHGVAEPKSEAGAWADMCKMSLDY